MGQEVPDYSPTPLGLSTAPGNPFWPPGDEFRGSGRREYKAQPLHLAQLLTLTHATPSPVLCRSCASIAEVPLGLVHLGFHFGGVVMRFVEVAGVSARLTAFFSTCAS